MGERPVQSQALLGVVPAMRRPELERLRNGFI